MVVKAIEAANQLEEQGISAEVINIHTIKPLDREAVAESVRKTGCAVTAEEHQRLGGLGSAIAQVLAEEHPVPLSFVAVQDSFGESGTTEQLLTKYGLQASNIVEAARSVISRK